MQNPKNDSNANFQTHNIFKFFAPKLGEKLAKLSTFPIKQNMNSRNQSIRVLGQRSIPSTFIVPSPNKSVDCKERVQICKPTNDSRVSLSDFLNRKLKKNSGPHKSLQGKERPFSFPVSSADASEKESEKTEFLDAVLEQFKHTSNEKQEYCIHSSADGAVGNGSMNKDCIRSSADGGIGIQKIQDSRKRSFLQFQGGNHKQSGQKGLVVLGGGDPIIPKRQQKQQRLKSPEKPRPVFNHYANGRGWWDCDMEGVDNDEVGHNEVWEGVGSTTLGGLDWH